MMDNPWRLLPDKPPLVLSIDKTELGRVDPEQIDLENLPSPFVGRRDASVVLLGNIAGRSEPGKPPQDLGLKFKSMRRENLIDGGLDQFVFFSPGIPSNWWDRKLKHLLELRGGKKDTREVLARNLLTIEFFPYVSRSNSYSLAPKNGYCHNLDKIHLPSQAYSFFLIEKAIERNALIVIRYGKRRWLKHVPKLRKYDRLVLLSSYLPGTVIGPTTCLEEGWALIESEVTSMK